MSGPGAFWGWRTMHPELFTIPGFNYSVKSYGFCVMVGFLSAAWFAMRRATRVKCDPDLVLNMCFIGLIFGMVGSRVFYVIHYWKSVFAGAPNKLVAIFDVSSGGFEFLGAVIGAVPAVGVYLWMKKQSIRLYLDIVAPGLMWGLAFGRVGCFLNGCCFGGPTDASWAVRFPYGSPAFIRQWEERQLAVPAEFILTSAETPSPTLLPAAVLNLPIDKVQGPTAKIEELKRRLRDIQESRQALQAGAGDLDPAAAAEELKALDAEERRISEESRRAQIPPEIAHLHRAQFLPSREHPERFPMPEFPPDTPRTSLSELHQLAAGLRSLPVHPTQLYATIGGLLLSFLLSSLFYQRKRHGTVFGVMLLLYPVMRLFEEIIRTDNPRDIAGLTISQFISVVIFLVGVAYLFVVCKRLPQLSPYAKAFVPAEEPAPAAS